MKPSTPTAQRPSPPEAAPQPTPAAAAAVAVPTIPVICDKCRAEGQAGDGAFAQIADILDFEPVPRRRNVNAWTPEHQRAFIAALALTGSAWQAAKAVGRHHYGAEQLRTAKGGRGFDKAWAAALEIARERELAKLQSDLAGLTEERAAAEASRGEAKPAGRRHRWGDYDDEDAGENEYLDAKERIRERLLRARRLYLSVICSDAEMRSAWETLVGPVDWDKAERMEPQDNEPFPVSLRKPDMLLAVEEGMLHDMVGAGPDFMGELGQALAEYRQTGKLPGDEEEEEGE